MFSIYFRLFLCSYITVAPYLWLAATSATLLKGCFVDRRFSSRKTQGGSKGYKLQSNQE